MNFRNDRLPRTWLIDVGNTRVKWTLAGAPEGSATSFIAHGGQVASLESDRAFAGVREGDAAWVASVAVPALREHVVQALQRRGARVHTASTRPFLAGVRISYADPSRLGVDRFLALLAAHARARQAWLIANVGTALTLDLLDASGTHHGGLIVPSPTLMREALTQRAPHLPVQGGAVVDFANDTADALASGSILAARALIADRLRAAKRRLGTAPLLLIAGGGATALCDRWRVRAESRADLVLEGLAVYAQAASAIPGG